MLGQVFDHCYSAWAMRRVFRVGLGLVFTVALACDEVGEEAENGDEGSVEACEQHASQAACDAQHFEPNEDGIAHQCAWVEVYSPAASGEECDRGEPSHQCVLTLEVEEGCGPEACEDAKIRTYYKYEEDTIQVARWPSCGGWIYGDWTKCDTGTEPSRLAACRCVC